MRRAAWIAGAVLLYIAAIVALAALLGTSGTPAGEFRQLVTMLLVTALPAAAATALLARAWWERAQADRSIPDAPARLLAMAVATLPGDRREWAEAMEAELATVQRRDERWRFALSASWTAAFPPGVGHSRGLLAGGAAIVLLVATALVVSSTVPELRLFSLVFVAANAALAMLAIAHRRRLAPSPAVAGVVVAAVAGCIAVVVASLDDPGTEGSLPPAYSILLAATLTGFLWLGLAPPRTLVAGRLGVGFGVGVAVAVAVAAGFARATNAPYEGDSAVIGFLFVVPAATFFLASWLVALVGRSTRSALQTAVWAGALGTLLLFVVWMIAGGRQAAAGAGLLMDGDAPPRGQSPGLANIEDAVYCVLVFLPLWALPLGIVGAFAGGWLRSAREGRAQVVA